ncbi:putative glucanase protein [Rutstroemia sp. NJR-2017a WRK4]|nr:putative glucanase protein [Rutstroemia sp. NJR-2017a WRK4]
MSNGILRTDGERIVDGSGKTVILRGAGLGGWMNMENFITGYPATEHQHRASMLKVLGKEKYEFFFDKFLEYFFMEDDAKFFASVGLNCLRLPFNYRHFEDDMNPRVLKESGFKHLDRVIDLCAKYNIYTVLDMHTVPGAQNPDWHSDNFSNYATFWDHKDHQDRTIWLWSELAKHYRNNPWVAGYNPINEPCDPLHYRLPAFYNRFEAEIRKVDPDHILFLDGNTFAIEWKHFDNVLPNCVYALHDYSTMGFPTGEPFTGSPAQIEKLERQFLRKCSFQTANKVAAWNGEFGPVYESDPKAEDINTQRYNLLGAQLKLYQKHQTPWSIWLYKDLGLQGMVRTDPDSPYHKLVAPFLEKKKELNLDCWGAQESKSLTEALSPFVKWIEENAPKAKEQYPTPWGVERQIRRAVLESYVASSFSDEFAELFAGKSEKELDELAASWKYENCAKREGLNKVLGEFAESRGSD